MGKRADSLARMRALRAIEQKWCPTCETAHGLDKFQANPARVDGLEWQCTNCKRTKGMGYMYEHKQERAAYAAAWRLRTPSIVMEEKARAYRSTNRAHIMSANVAYRERFPDRKRAINAVQTGLRNGTLRKTACWYCGSERHVEAHHSSYEKDMWLAVVWLCRGCHTRTHAAFAADLSA